MRSVAIVGLLVVAAALLLLGCIVTDELTTLTLASDGSAELVTYRSNLRSSEAGAKGEQELRDYAASFDAGSDSDQVRIRAAGGTVVESRWIRRAVPAANLTSARFPDAAALEKYFTQGANEDELRTEAHFTRDGSRRKLLLILLPPKQFELPRPRTLPESRQQQADGISETRVAVADGEITGARGFTVAGDRRSALLALDEIAELLRADPRRVELFVEWTVRAK